METCGTWVQKLPGRIEAPARRKGVVKTPAEKAAEFHGQWADAKATRACPMAKASPQQRRDYRSSVLEDQRAARKQFFPDAPRRPRAAAQELAEDIDNGSGLPAAFLSEVSKGLEGWCRFGSWGSCRECGIMQARPLHEKCLAEAGPPTFPKSLCKRCSSKRKPYVPHPEHVPEPLQGLSEEAIAALRPLEFDVGPEERARTAWGADKGYRKHTQVIRFSWATLSVKDKIKRIPDRDERRAARAALWYLKHADDSAYMKYHQEHLQFLRHYDDSADTQTRRLPVGAMERLGLECAVWPHLYWKTDMCETYVRLADSRRTKEARRKRRQGGDGHDNIARDNSNDSDATADSSSDDEQSDDNAAAGNPKDTDSGRTSMKQSFSAKLRSPLLGYAASYELLQFVYDLNLWTALGSKRNLQSGVPLRLLMSGHSFSPQYWKRMHQGLTDLVRQVGYPTVFFTMSPWEMSAPYHDYLLDDMKKLLRTRLHLAPMETLHLSHLCTQLVSGLLTGSNQQKARGDRCWRKHILSCKTGDGDKSTVVNFFTRLEFQDGSRKETTQKYHGSGRPHLHCLLWLEDVADIELEKCLSATLPTDETQAAYVKGSQDDRSGDSKWNVHAGPSSYDDNADRLHLHHTQDDSEAGRRAYFPDIMDALKCHQDVQMSAGDALLLKYVTKYVSKFSDSNYDDWLNDKAAANSIAWRVLKEYHPFEPEMVLQLEAANFRQWGVGTKSRGLRHVVAPDGSEITAEMKAYMKSSWRRRT
jgi:hypothetical protein